MYLNNCVGYGNRRNFFIFLFFATLGCGYAVLMLALAAWTNYNEIFRIIHPVCLPTVMASFMQKPPGWEDALSHGKRPHYLGNWELVDGAEGVRRCLSKWGMWTFVGFTSFSTAFMIFCGAMLGVQIYLLAKGTTQLEYSNGVCLCRSSEAHTWKERLLQALMNVHGVVGPPQMWVWPRQGPLAEECSNWPAPRLLKPIEGDRTADETMETSTDSVPKIVERLCRRALDLRWRHKLPGLLIKDIVGKSW